MCVAVNVSECVHVAVQDDGVHELKLMFMDLVLDAGKMASSVRGDDVHTVYGHEGHVCFRDLCVLHVETHHEDLWHGSCSPGIALDCFLRNGFHSAVV